MSIFNSLQFDGIDSMRYGVYITGQSVYNAPKREIETVSVPGRNGDIIIDSGHYSNIEVTYRCGCFASSPDEFSRKLAEFRSMLTSRVGYKRIMDTYNKDEYRLGFLANTISLDNVIRCKAGEFEITFNCKPFRYLLNGEVSTPITSGQLFFNPTPFDAQPLLAIRGYGAIELSGYELNIVDEPIGSIVLADAAPIERNYIENPATLSVEVEKNLDTRALNAGDPITISRVLIFLNTHLLPGNELSYSAVISNTGTEVEYGNFSSWSDNVANVGTFLYNLSFVKGTAKTYTRTIEAKLAYYSPSGVMESFTEVITVDYDGDSTITLSISFTTAGTYYYNNYTGFSHEAILADSSKSILGDPIYIDCELGEAYKYEYGEVVSLNANIQLGSLLPVLKPGPNEITFDNTISGLELTPRWVIL